MATTNLGLSQPAQGTLDWHSLLNTNFGLVDDGVTRAPLFGLTLSNNATDATNDIDIAAGAAVARSGSLPLTLASALTKQLDATWAAGTNQGGRASSQALANGTWHVHLIRVAGATDIGFDTSATAANLIADHGATHYRRIGSILRESLAIVGFVQNGDKFMRKTYPLDVNATNPGTAAVTRTLSVPTGIKVEAIFSAYADSPTANAYWLFTDLDETDQAPSGSLLMLASDTAVRSGIGTFRVWTNTNGQIRSRTSGSDANTLLRIMTHGWIDQRGKDA